MKISPFDITFDDSNKLQYYLAHEDLRLTASGPELFYEDPRLGLLAPYVKNLL